MSDLLLTALRQFYSDLDVEISIEDWPTPEAESDDARRD